MSLPRVYIETTIPSAYFETRSAPEMIARRGWTRRWWDRAGNRYERVTGLPVLDELFGGPAPRRGAWLELVRDLPLLDLDPAIVEIVTMYAKHKLMPVRDGFHLAFASYHKCDFLLTWDFKHLANARKFTHIRKVNSLLGLVVPAIVTPMELWRGTHDKA